MENYQQLPGSCQKDSGAYLNKFPLAKDEIIWVAIKIIPAIDWNTSNTLISNWDYNDNKKNNTQQTLWSPMENANGNTSLLLLWKLVKKGGKNE